jgi:sulfonate transport system substrate-binding protein
MRSPRLPLDPAPADLRAGAPHRAARPVAIAVALLGVLAALSSCGGSDGGGAAQAAAGGGGGPKLRIGFISTQKDLNGPEGFSYGTGKFKEILATAGITDIETAAFPNGPPLSEAIKGGSIDVGIYGDTPALTARANGLPTRLLNQSTLDLEAFLVTKAGGPASVADLDGKTVGVQKGSYIHRYLLGLLEKKGLGDKVKVVDLATTEADAALGKGDLDAYAAPAPQAFLLAKKYPVIDRIRKDNPDLAGSTVAVVTQAYADAHPRFAAAWRQARTQAVAEVKADTPAYLAFQAKVQNLPQDKIGDQLAEIYPVDAYPTETLVPRGRALLEGTKKFLVEQKLVKKDFTIDEWVLP